jgi:creatinine amidohydrolase
MKVAPPHIEDWDLTSSNLDRLKNRQYEVAVIPTCAIEAHNYHLPEGQDFFQATYVARRCCKEAWEKKPSVLCLPAIPFGVDCNLMDFPLSIHLSQDTLNQVLKEIFQSLLHYGIQKIVILNSHGGNNFTAFVRQIQCDLDIHVFICNWWTVGKDKSSEIFDHEGDHADEMETSVALNLYPHLVEMEKAKEGAVPPFRFEALEKGWVSSSRNFGKLNDHCGVGSPKKATAEKGKAYLDLSCQRITDFLIQLASTPIDDSFPHQT